MADCIGTIVVPRKRAHARKAIFKKKIWQTRYKHGFKQFRGNTWVEPLREWVNDTKQAAFLSSSTDFHKISSFVQKIGTNHAVRDKTARFAVPSPFTFVATRRRFLPPCAPSARRESALRAREVSECALILNHARTFFERSS